MERLEGGFSEMSERAREELFEAMWNETLTKQGGAVEYRGEYPKREFLEFLVREKNVLLHGSNVGDLDTLEPREANDRSKKFGNLEAVYATQDEVLPIFHAIQDQERFQGVAESGFQEKRDSETGKIKKEYHFSIDSKMMKQEPWSDGVVYILSRESFDQGTDDEGNPIDEFVSRTPVKPIAVLKVGPNDFPYMDQIERIESA